MTPRDEIMQCLLVSLRTPGFSCGHDCRMALAALIEHQNQLLEVAIDRLATASGRSFEDTYNELMAATREKYWTP